MSFEGDHYLAPKAALKRFADSLDTAANPDLSRFKDINRQRVDDFIRKPYVSDGAKVPVFQKPSRKSPNIRVYNESTSVKVNKSLPVDAPEFQKSLGPRSRFGDGDGSFWDKWLNVEKPVKGLGIDKDGIPVSGYPLAASMGFKRYQQPQQVVPPSKVRSKVSSYNERRKARQAEEKGHNDAADEMPYLSSPHGQGLRDASWEDVTTVSAADESTTDIFHLPPISPVQRDTYFGSKARAGFFDVYRQLSRVQHTLDKPEEYIHETTTHEPTPRLAHEFQKKYAIFAKSREIMSFTEEDLFAVFNAPDESFPRIAENEVTAEEEERWFAMRRNYPSMLQTSKSPKLVASELHEKVTHDQHMELNDQPATKSTPKPSMLIRKEVTATLNLEHLCMGDEAAMLLGNALDGMPCLADLNIADNKLTDVGLSAILNGLRTCKYLSSLDVSENKIDHLAATAIAKFLESPTCSLVNFVLSRADVDDNEIGLFISAIGNCKSLRHVDLSSNLIGSNQYRQAVDGSLTMGGKVIGEMLSDRSCRLESLRLSWNTIRYDGGVALAHSLKENNSLTFLDLSYNALGQDGGEMLGDSLYVNRALRTLLIANNNITSRACVTIAEGMRYCTSLKEIDISNNPIGERGARALMMFTAEFGPRILINTRGCSLRTVDDSAWFDIENPCGDISLDLSIPYERAVAIAIFRISARSKRLLRLDNLRYLPDAKIDSRGSQELKLFLVEESSNASYVTSLLPPEELVERVQQLSQYSHLQAAKNLFMSLSHEYEQLSKNAVMLPREGISKLLNKLGLGYYGFIAKHLLSLYDTSYKDVIDLLEFAEYLEYGLPRYIADWQRAVEGSWGRYYYSTYADGEEYVPPHIGRITGTISFVYDDYGKTGSNRRLLPLLDLEHIITASKATDDVFTMVEYALTHCQLKYDEARVLLRFLLKEVGDQRLVLRKLLPKLITPTDARILLHFAMRDDVSSRIRFRSAMGPIYRTLVGAPTGYYHLSLSNAADRQCLQNLVNISHQHENARKASGLGDISQYRDWSGFRNCVLDGQPFQLTEKWYLQFISSNRRHQEKNSPKKEKLDAKGKPIVPEEPMKCEKLEFDFVAFEGPRKGCTSMLDSRFTALITNLLKSVDADDVDISTALEAWSDTSFVDFTYPDYRQSMPRKIDSETDRCTEYRDWCLSNITKREIASIPRKYMPFARLASQAERDAIRFSRLEALRSSTKSANASRSYDSADPEEQEEEPPPPRRKLVILESRSMPMVEEDSVSEMDPVETVDELGFSVSGETIQESIGSRFLSCSQMLFLLQLMDNSFPTRSFSSPRVDTIIALFNQLVDIVEFKGILNVLKTIEIGMMEVRLGWRCMWNPLSPNAYYSLNLANREDRYLARMLLTLAVAAAPSKCLHHLSYQEEGSNARVTDWPLPTTEATLPKSGVMRGLFMPDKDSRLNSDSELRTSMLALVFASSTFKSVNPKLKGPGEPTVSNVSKLAIASGLAFDFEDCPPATAVTTAATASRKEK